MFVQDGEHADRLMQEQAVLEVLAEIGADEVPRVVAMNKVDQRDEVQPGRDEAGRIWISAVSGLGMEDLRDAIAEAIGQAPSEHDLTLTPQEGKLRARLYQEADVLAESANEFGETAIRVRISDARLTTLLREVGRNPLP